ncbi:MAG: hypothetical protein M1479_05855 [Actinobacteria bacterium]|nr:hypothetical protein [Actinomycetota bacterium]
MFINKENEDNFQKALNLQKTNSIPIYLPAHGHFLINWLGITAKEYILNPIITLKSQIKFIERFHGIKGVIGPDYGIALLPSIFGADIMWKVNDVPWVEPLIKSVKDLNEFVDIKELPEPAYSGLMPAFISSYSFMKKELGDLLSFPTSTNSPYCFADYLCGSVNLYKWVMDCPGLVLRLLEKLKNYLIKHMKFLQDFFGFNYDVIYMKDDQSSYLSPQQFKIFVNPFCEEIFCEIGRGNAYRMWHSDGPLFNHIENIIDLKINSLNFFDPNNDISKFREKIGGKICLIGNVHPIKILKNGTPDMVIKECKRQIEVMNKTVGYVLSVGGEIPAGTAEDNIEALIDGWK